MLNTKMTDMLETSVHLMFQVEIDGDVSASGMLSLLHNSYYGVINGLGNVYLSSRPKSYKPSDLKEHLRFFRSNSEDIFVNYSKAKNSTEFYVVVWGFVLSDAEFNADFITNTIINDISELKLKKGFIAFERIY